MTVKELQEKLDTMPEDYEVMIIGVGNDEKDIPMYPREVAIVNNLQIGQETKAVAIY